MTDQKKAEGPETQAVEHVDQDLLDFEKELNALCDRFKMNIVGVPQYVWKQDLGCFATVVALVPQRRPERQTS